ncbi:iron donor protein CyaY [Orbaceae bacterium ac157xtp]
MNINQFHQLVETQFNNIEQSLDKYAEEYDADIDYQTNGNVLTISFENKSKIIINTQEPLFQIWMATKHQGYHFDYKDNQWICSRSGESFDKLFNEAVTEQLTA